MTSEVGKLILNDYMLEPVGTSTVLLIESVINFNGETTKR